MLYERSVNNHLPVIKNDDTLRVNFLKCPRIELDIRYTYSVKHKKLYRSCRN